MTWCMGAWFGAWVHSLVYEWAARPLCMGALALVHGLCAWIHGFGAWLGAWVHDLGGCGFGAWVHGFDAWVYGLLGA